MASRRGAGPFLGRFGTRFSLALVVYAALMVAAVVAVNRTIDREVARIPRIPVTTSPAGPDGANYLLVGSDSRSFVDSAEERSAFGSADKETGKRSDTMMVVHVEPATGRTLVVSFPRDLWVNVPGIGNQKINAAFNQDLGGGPDSVIATLQSTFGIDVNHYVEVDFESFQQMVDAIGTVPVYVDRPLVDQFTGFVALKAGCYQLGGADALAWARARHVQYFNATTGRLEDDPRADIGRIERQQEFIRRLMGSVVEVSLRNPFTARDIARRVTPYLRVDEAFTTRDALQLAQAFRSVSSADTSAVEFTTFPFTEGSAGGQAVLFPDRTNGQVLLDRLATFATAPIVVDAVTPTDVRVRVLNASGRSGLGQQTLDGLVALGFLKGGVGDDQRGRVSVTEVRVAPGADAKARLVLGHVGADAKLVIDPLLKGTDVEVVLGGDFAGLDAAAPDAASVPGDATPADLAVAAAAACR